jgi:hypothetical protein
MASLVSKGIVVLKPENVAQLVFFIRGEKVLLDADLAMLYGVEPRVLNQAWRETANVSQRTSCFSFRQGSTTL